MNSSMRNGTVKNHQFHVCIVLKDLHHKGIFYDVNPLDQIYSVFILQVILSVVISRALHIILNPLKQSKLVCNILAGIILGPSVLGRNNSYTSKIFAPKETIVIATVSNMATVLSVFLTCIKMDGSLLVKSGKKTWTIGLSCMIISFIFTAAVTFPLRNILSGIGRTNGFPLQFCIVSSLSFFIVIANALDELNLLTSELGQLAISIAMLSELVSGLIIVAGVVHGQLDGIQYVIYALLSLCALVLFAITVIRPILHWIIKETPKGQQVKECYVIAILIVTMLFGVITDALGASFIPGAMMVGLFIPDKPPLGATIVKRCEVLVSEFFLPFFFVRVGYFTDLPAIRDWNEFFALGAVILAGYLGRLVGSVIVSSSFNMRKSSAMLLSLILSLQGLVELLYVFRWKHLQQLSDQNFATLVLSIVIMNALITPILSIIYKPEAENFDMPCSFKLNFKSLEMTSSIGELRIIACVQEEENVPSIVSLLKALNPNEQSPICAYVVHLVPLATQTIPVLSPYNNHKRRFNKPDGSDSIMRAFLNYAENSHGPVQIQPFRMVSPVKYMHQPICKLSETTHTPLIIVPFLKYGEAPTIDGILRIFNSNIQAYSKCTVGILVDRGLHTHTCLTNFSYNVAVIFIGGADDREALSLAARISRHPNITITVFRIHMTEDESIESGIEKELDYSLLREFKAMNINNTCVVFNEFVAHDIEDVMKTLQSLGNTYNLIVVGKRHEIPNFEERLICWTEYPELGILGDAIAAPDFHVRVMSILVLQQYDNNRELRASRRESFFSTGYII